ncbi:chloride channel protein [Bifidobacterium sp.]|jgi:H+/Cl- antiporter ClcA|uniref:chloride channel protein n=1 Tax=Bifidobacterium sp. TaxID=41200 RepID=UPI0025BA65E0|nr:chloride channel protein [Bifidobacterium sp.]MCH4210029.1 chloride channel protein [Bifidobacterium sp.]MCI1225431.1 chloride channel protein [Bifidobacterium sp.]
MTAETDSLLSEYSAPSPHSARTRTVRLIAAILTLGIAIGVAAGLLSQMLYGVEYLAFGYIERSSLPGPFTVPALRRIAGVVGGALIAAVIWWLLRTKTTRVPSVNRAVNGETMPVWQTTVHVLLQILIVGSGSSIGREVAPREFGAMLGQRFSGLIGFTGADKRMLVAACAGAGLAGVYDAPLAGMFFAVEVLLADVTLEKVTVSLAVSGIAAYVASLIRGQNVFYRLPGLIHGNTPRLMLFALIGGMVFGSLGALFRLGSQWAEKGPRNDAGILWKMPAAALLTGVVAIWLPQVMGNGRASAQLAFEPSLISRLGKAFGLSLFGTSAGQSLTMALAVLTVSLVAKALVTLATIRSGASGGVLQPGIALGAITGALLGLLWAAVFPAAAIPAAACALIGSAALLSASQQAPLMAMCLVMELCAAPISYFVPVALAVAVAVFVSQWVLKRCNAAFSRSERKTPRTVG